MSFMRNGVAWELGAKVAMEMRKSASEITFINYQSAFANPRLAPDVRPLATALGLNPHRHHRTKAALISKQVRRHDRFSASTRFLQKC